jgi:hypothetical protein
MYFIATQMGVRQHYRTITDAIWHDRCDAKYFVRSICRSTSSSHYLVNSSYASCSKTPFMPPLVAFFLETHARHLAFML